MKKLVSSVAIRCTGRKRIRFEEVTDTLPTDLVPLVRELLLTGFVYFFSLLFVALNCAVFGTLPAMSTKTN